MGLQQSLSRGHRTTGARAPSLPAGARDGHWPLRALSNSGWALLPGKPVVTVAILGCGMGHCIHLMPDPPRLTLVPGLPSYRSQDPRHLLSVETLGPDSVDLATQPFPSLSTGQAPGPCSFECRGDGMQHLGLGRVKEVSEGPHTLLHPTPALGTGPGSVGRWLGSPPWVAHSLPAPFSLSCAPY